MTEGLWDECTNWRVLQATAQSDIQSALLVNPVLSSVFGEMSYLTPHELRRPIFQVVPLPGSIFNFSRTR